MDILGHDEKTNFNHTKSIIGKLKIHETLYTH